MAIEQRPLTLLQSAGQRHPDQDLRLRLLQSAESAFRDAARALAKPDDLVGHHRLVVATRRSVAVGDDIGRRAPAATTSPCRPSPRRSRSPRRAYADNTTLVGAGTLHIDARQLGRPPARLHAAGRRAPPSTSPSPTTDTLADVRDKINAAERRRHAPPSSPTPAARGWSLRSSATGAGQRLPRHRRPTTTATAPTPRACRRLPTTRRPAPRHSLTQAARRTPRHRQRPGRRFGQQHADRRRRRPDPDLSKVDQRAGRRSASRRTAPRSSRRSQSFVSAYNDLASTRRRRPSTTPTTKVAGAAAGRQHRRRAAAPAAQHADRRLRGLEPSSRRLSRDRPRDAAGRHPEASTTASSTRRSATSAS